MGKKILIKTGSFEQQAELNESEAAKKIWEALPIEGSASLWGDEIYFPIPVNSELEQPVRIVEKGDIAYWGAGDSFCIFFGPTPQSEGDEIRAASVVQVVGKLLGDPEEFKSVLDGELITLKKAED